MPTFKGQLSEEQIIDLIAYIKTLGNGIPGGGEQAGGIYAQARGLGRQLRYGHADAEYSKSGSDERPGSEQRASDAAADAGREILISLERGCRSKCLAGGHGRRV